MKIFTRAAHDWSDKFPNLTMALSSLNVESAILDGEAVVMDEYGRSNFGQLQNALSLQDDSKIRIYLFDLLYLNGEDLRAWPLRKRKDLLFKLIAKSCPPIFHSEDVKGNGPHFFDSVCHYQLEGMISKDSSAPYFSGRSRRWCKSKCRQRQEFVIGGFTSGKSKRAADFGALLLGVYELVKGKKLLRYAGRVGTGLSAYSLREIKKNSWPWKQSILPLGSIHLRGKVFIG